MDVSSTPALDANRGGMKVKRTNDRTSDPEELTLRIAARLLLHLNWVGSEEEADKALSKARRYMRLEALSTEDLPGVCRIAVENWLPELSGPQHPTFEIDGVVMQLRQLAKIGKDVRSDMTES